MDKYDVLIVGGAIAGSVAARFAAKAGLKTLLVEKEKVPRHKACSGIQFGYFEKILGAKIPPEALCTNKLSRVRLILPTGFRIATPFKMFNFTRDYFDHWLNKLAMAEGAEFRDGVAYKAHEWVEGGYKILLKPKEGAEEWVETKYLIAADGLRSNIRQKQKGDSLAGKSAAATLNYYIKGTSSKLDPKSLYMFWNMEFSNLMFAWVYMKNDLWVVGTGYTEGIVDRCNQFYKHVQEKYGLVGEIVKKEGYSTDLNLHNEDHVYLGEGNLLNVGDAAGLVDLFRGVGMDSAALSGRRAVKAILDNEKDPRPDGAVGYYSLSMAKLVDKINKNMDKQIFSLKDNKDLMKFMKKNMLPMGMGMLFGSLANKFLSWDKVVLLPS
jgi:flavin-dependent dehydrogenase